MEGIPTGFRFYPSDEELITSYLLRKVNGLELPWDIVRECDLYGDNEPWKIFDGTSEKYVYVFTVLKKRSQKRITRTAGCGTWKGQSKGIHIFDPSNKKLIGFKKLFSFEVKKGPSSKINHMMGYHYIMHEFSLAVHNIIGLQSNDYVLCRIKRKRAKSLEDGQAIERNLEHEVHSAGDGVAVEAYVENPSHYTQGLNTRTPNSEEGEQPRKKMRSAVITAEQCDSLHATDMLTQSSTELALLPPIERNLEHEVHSVGDQVAVEAYVENPSDYTQDLSTRTPNSEEGEQPRKKMRSAVITAEQCDSLHATDMLTQSSTELALLPPIIDLGEYESHGPIVGFYAMENEMDYMPPPNLISEPVSVPKLAFDPIIHERISAVCEYLMPPHMLEGVHLPRQF